MTDNDLTVGVCVPVTEPCRVLGVGAPLALIVESDRVEYTEVPPEGTSGDAAVSGLDLDDSNSADEREGSRTDGLFPELS